MIRDTGSFDVTKRERAFSHYARQRDSELRTELVLEPGMARNGRDILEVFYTPRRGCRLGSHDLEEYLTTRSFLW